MTYFKKHSPVKGGLINEFTEVYSAFSKQQKTITENRFDRNSIIKQSVCGCFSAARNNGLGKHYWLSN